MKSMKIDKKQLVTENRQIWSFFTLILDQTPVFPSGWATFCPITGKSRESGRFHEIWWFGADPTPPGGVRPPWEALLGPPPTLGGGPPPWELPDRNI